MVSYLSKFIKNLSDKAASLRNLDKKNVKWEWTQDDSKAFNELKNNIGSLETLKYFDPQQEVTI